MRVGASKPHARIGPGSAFERAGPQRWVMWLWALSVVGIIGGLSSSLFLGTLEVVTARYEHNTWLIWLLPVVGLILATGRRRLGLVPFSGTSHLVRVLESESEECDWRVGPVALGGTLLSHFAGASVGREGTGVQISASFSDTFLRLLDFPAWTRQLLLVPAVAAGFAGVFGVPWAGAAFALEFAGVAALGGMAGRQRLWASSDTIYSGDTSGSSASPRSVTSEPFVTRRDRVKQLVPVMLLLGAGAAAAAWVSHTTVLATGLTHLITPDVGPIPIGQGIRVVVFGLATGLVARMFVAAQRGIRALPTRLGGGPELWSAWVGLLVAGVVILGGLVAYSGLSIEMLADALHGDQSPPWAWLIKLTLTVLLIGTGYVGGEVTPLFVIGATLGAASGGEFGPALAALGMVGVFGAAANTPIAAVILAVELFGWNVLGPAVVVVGIASVVSGKGSIYREAPAVGRGQ